MIRVLSVLFILLFPLQDLYNQSQDTPVYNIAIENFNNLKSAFLEYSTYGDANKLIYDKLDELQQAIGQAHTNQQDRYLLNSLVADIKAFKALLTGLIRDRVPDHLTESNVARIKTIFGIDCVFAKIKVKMTEEDSKEIEFYELTISKLRATYFHNKSNTARNGLRIKCRGSYNGSTFTGECGAFNGEYTPVNNNVDGNYTKITSAKITERF